MAAALVKRRLPASERRSGILQAASRVFAEQGYAAATTYSIAQRANVSEALLFRHFESKEVLYSEVLRLLTAVQDARLALLPMEATNLVDFARLLRIFFHECLSARPTDEIAIAQRTHMASLVSDGRHARAIYRRAVRIRAPVLRKVLAMAEAQNALNGPSIDPTNAMLFMDHIGAMMMVGRMHARTVIPYVGDDADLVRQATLFSLRGLGFSPSLLEAVEADDREAALKD